MSNLLSNQKEYKKLFLETFSNQFDLDPSTIDNVDPLDANRKKLSFMQSKIEKILDKDNDVNDNERLKQKVKNILNGDCLNHNSHDVTLIKDQ